MGQLTNCGIKDNDWTSQMPLVSKIALNYHGDCGSTIRRSNETLSLGNRKAHTVPEDDRKEICDSVGVLFPKSRS